VFGASGQSIAYLPAASIWTGSASIGTRFPFELTAQKIGAPHERHRRFAGRSESGCIVTAGSRDKRRGRPDEKPAPALLYEASAEAPRVSDRPSLLPAPSLATLERDARCLTGRSLPKSPGRNLSCRIIIPRIRPRPHLTHPRLRHLGNHARLPHPIRDRVQHVALLTRQPPPVRLERRRIPAQPVGEIPENPSRGRPVHVRARRLERFRGSSATAPTRRETVGAPIGREATPGSAARLGSRHRLIRFRRLAPTRREARIRFDSPYRSRSHAARCRRRHVATTPGGSAKHERRPPQPPRRKAQAQRKPRRRPAKPEHRPRHETERDDRPHLSLPLPLRRLEPLGRGALHRATRALTREQIVTHRRQQPSPAIRALRRTHTADIPTPRARGIVIRRRLLVRPFATRIPRHLFEKPYQVI
jgi:hypothetical protein